jgi:PPOX class probable F420-dependent enzyme
MPEPTDKDTAIFERQPPLRRLRDEERERLLRQRDQGVLATVSPGGFPHLAPVLFSWDPSERTVRISTRAGRVKAVNLAGNPRAALHVDGPDRWSFVVAEGRGEVSPLTIELGDTTGRELLSMFPQADAAAEADFLDTQVAEQRVVLRLHVSRLYGDIIEVAS